MKNESTPRTAHHVLPGDAAAFAPVLSQYNQQAADFLAKHGIKCRITLSNSKTPQWDDAVKGERNHYRVTLSSGQGLSSRSPNLPRRLVFDFWGSINDAAKGNHPSVYDILTCVNSDSSCPETFADFCGEFGYNEDSIKARQLFTRCSSFAKRIRAFFTDAELADLSEIQ